MKHISYGQGSCEPCRCTKPKIQFRFWLFSSLSTLPFSLAHHLQILLQCPGSSRNKQYPYPSIPSTGLMSYIHTHAVLNPWIQEFHTFLHQRTEVWIARSIYKYSPENRYEQGINLTPLDWIQLSFWAVEATRVSLFTVSHVSPLLW